MNYVYLVALPFETYYHLFPKFKEVDSFVGEGVKLSRLRYSPRSICLTNLKCLNC